MSYVFQNLELNDFTEKVYADYIQSDVHKEVREKISFYF